MPAPSVPSTVNDHYNDKSSSSGGEASLRPDVAAAVPLAVPGRFGRGFARKPDVTPTAGGLQHDCRTFGCTRQAAGPSAATAVGEVHCCVLCFETEGGRHSRGCDGGAALEAPSGTQRPWAPGAPRDNTGLRTDVPLRMDESDDPTGIGEVDRLGASRSITPEIREAAAKAIGELQCEASWSREAAVEELVELWVTFPMEPTDLETTLRIAQIEHVTNRPMKDIGRHEEVVRLYRCEFLRRFGDHLDASRIDKVPGLTDEVRSVLKSVADHGARVDEVGPRWDLRLNMNAKLAEEHGKSAVEKVIKDGRNGRIVLFSSLVEKQLLEDDRRLMVAKVIRVAKRFLSGAINPADSRWCNSQLDAGTLTPAKGIGPGGSVRLPTQLDAAKGMLIVAFARPGLLAFYSKHDVSEAFRLI